LSITQIKINPWLAEYSCELGQLENQSKLIA